MNVNGIPAALYGGKQLKVETQAPEEIVGYEWVEGAAVPTQTDVDIGLGTLTVEMVFRGPTRDKILKNISRFLSLFREPADVILDGYSGKYRAFLTGSTTAKTIRKEYYRLTIEAAGYFYDEEETETLEDVTELYFYVAGSRKTPCTVEIYANNDLSGYEIDGLTEDTITIESLEAGKTLIITGDGTATIDGENAFSQVDLWEFPVLEPGENAVTVSSTDATVTIRYNPMWL